MSYFELSTEQRLAVGITDTLVRYAVGVESSSDLIDDLLQAFAQTE
jgi:cystathionine gamma-synthase